MPGTVGGLLFPLSSSGLPVPRVSVCTVGAIELWGRSQVDRGGWVGSGVGYRTCKGFSFLPRGGCWGESPGFCVGKGESPGRSGYSGTRTGKVFGLGGVGESPFGRTRMARSGSESRACRGFGRVGGVREGGPVLAADGEAWGEIRPSLVATVGPTRHGLGVSDSRASFIRRSVCLNSGMVMMLPPT